MYRNKKEHQYLNKIYANVLSRKSPYFKRTLSINHKFTDVQIIKLTKNDNFLEKIGGFSMLEKNTCFFIRHIKQFDTFLFNTRVDVVATDFNHRVVETLSNISPDNILRLPKKTHNV
jgi:hypothetical protein